MQQSTALAPSPDPDATWVISDGRAGNHRQAQALAQLLGRAYRDQLITVAQPWSAAAPRVLPSAAAAFGGEIRAVLDGSKPVPVLVIGCGRQSALATRLLRSRGACALQILDPRISSTHWDAVIAPIHDNLSGTNVLRVHGALHAVDAASMAQAVAAMPWVTAMPSPRIAVLLGGDTHKHAFDVRVAMNALHTLRRNAQGSLLISSSRRSPPALIKELQALPRRPELALWTGGNDADNPYLAFLGAADALVCSVDSVSMLSEAAATTAPLYLLGELRNDAPSRFARSLLENGRAQRFPDTGMVATAPVAPLRAMQDVATQLRQILA